jgi:hypothetical protein
MSAILLPFIAAGGIYLAIDAFSNKTRKHHRTHRKDSTKSTRSHRTKHSDTTNESSSETKTSSSTTDSNTKSAPLKSIRHRRKRRLSKVKDGKHLFSLRLGQRKQKSKKQLEKEPRNLFVFYSFGERNKDWDYKNLPSTWKMKRRVLSANRTSKYNNVDVFSGEKRYQDQMRHYLENAFSQLKINGIVKDYRIRGINTPM